MKLGIIFLAAMVSACVSTNTPTAEPTKDLVAPTLALSRHSSSLPIAQTLSPDSRVLSILLQGAEAKAIPTELGVGLLSDSFAIAVSGEGLARIAVDLRGNTAIHNGECELELLSPSGGARHWTTGQGAFSLTLTIDIRVPASLRLAVSGRCWAPSSGMGEQDAEALLFVDSLDIVSEAIPSAAQTPATKK